MKKTTNKKLILSVHPTAKGLGFSVFDSPQNLIDWGYSDIRINKRERTLKRLKSLIDLYQPDTIVLEDTRTPSFRRLSRIKKVITAITTTAIKQGIPVYHYSQEQIHQAFGRKNKDDRAKNITEVLPELAPSLPPKRRLWDRQHPQMQMFDAVALALTYFYLET